MDLCDLLRSVRVSLVADVRSLPRSARFPQHDQEALAEQLRLRGINYEWFGRELGGRRKSVPASAQVALPVEMRSYADHMATARFRHSVEDLLGLARKQAVVILCAERQPRYCHRSFLCDYIVTVSDLRVIHLLDADLTEEHEVSPLLRWVDQRPVYDRFVTGTLFPP